MKPGRYAHGSDVDDHIGVARAVVEDGWVFVAGTTGFDHETMTIAEDASDQCEQAFRNIERALQQVGADIDQAVRVTYVVPDPLDWDRCQPVASSWLVQAMPAATMISAPLPDARTKIEIEMTARLPD